MLKKVKTCRKLTVQLLVHEATLIVNELLLSPQVNHHVYIILICKVFLSISKLIAHFFFIKSNFINFLSSKIKISFPRLLVVNCNIIRMSRNVVRNQIDDMKIIAIKGWTQFSLLNEQKTQIFSQ